MYNIKHSYRNKVIIKENKDRKLKINVNKHSKDYHIFYINNNVEHRSLMLRNTCFNYPMYFLFIFCVSLIIPCMH